ncbi:hypothetical protein LZ31DRAFT_89154 [Colletotrichum somersetense]|nr:hypothetical protein LZ31DRAFT_89154 [Colletotrichum somersetense]
MYPFLLALFFCALTYIQHNALVLTRTVQMLPPNCSLLMDKKKINFRHVVVAKSAHQPVRLTLTTYFGCWDGITNFAHQPIRQRGSCQYQLIAAKKMADGASQASRRCRNRDIPKPKGTLHFVQDSRGRNRGGRGQGAHQAGMPLIGDAYDARTVTLFWTHRDRLRGRRSLAANQHGPTYRSLRLKG